MLHRPWNAKNYFIYDLRLCLNTKPGPTSFEDLRTVDGTIYETIPNSDIHSLLTVIYISLTVKQMIR